MAYSGSRSFAKKEVVDGIVFPSRKQARRYKELRLMVAAGLISELEIEPVFPLNVNGKKIGRFTADFRYKARDLPKRIVEEVKGYLSRDFPIRWNLVQALFPEFEFRLIK